MSADTDGRLYWLGRKLVQYIRTHEGSVKQELEEYTEIHEIVWDLNFRGIVLDRYGRHGGADAGRTGWKTILACTERTTVFACATKLKNGNDKQTVIRR